MNKENFTISLEALNEYYNGDIYTGLNLLGIGENNITNIMDRLITAISGTIDPKRKALYDDLAYDCSDYLCEWLFNTEGQLRASYPTPAALYDYIESKYKE